MALTKVQLVDLNSNELILDLDADTSLHSSTDDQIDIKIGGADDFKFTANTFTALAGSSIVVPDSGLTLGSTAVTSTAAELNLLDGVSGLVQADLTKLAALDVTATELNLLDDKDATHLAVPGKFEGTNFTRSMIIGHSTTGTLNDAVNNTGVGESALEDIVSGDDNTAVGRRSLRDLNTGGANTALGSGALQTVTGNSGNTGIGRSALSLTTGTNNIGLGLGAGSNITSGDGNVIIGGVDAASASGDRQLKIAGHDGSTYYNLDIQEIVSGNLTFAGDVTVGDDLNLTTDSASY